MFYFPAKHTIITAINKAAFFEKIEQLAKKTSYQQASAFCCGRCIRSPGLFRVNFSFQNFHTGVFSNCGVVYRPQPQFAMLISLTHLSLAKRENVLSVQSSTFRCNWVPNNYWACCVFILFCHVDKHDSSFICFIHYFIVPGHFIDYFGF